MSFKDPETAKEIVYKYHGVIFTFLLQVSVEAEKFQYIHDDNMLTSLFISYPYRCTADFRPISRCVSAIIQLCVLTSAVQKVQQWIKKVNNKLI